MIGPTAVLQSGESLKAMLISSKQHFRTDGHESAVTGLQAADNRERHNYS
jgi:hypothetical protein